MPSHFSRNLFASVFAQTLTILLQLWYTRFLLRTLGAEVYGLIPLALSFVSYLGLLTMSLNAGVGRHFTVSLGAGDKQHAQAVFGTALLNSILVAIPVGLIGCALTWQLPHLIQIPSGLAAQTQLFYGVSLACFLLAQLAGPFSLATFATNRLDLRAGLSIAEVTVRIVGAWVLLHFVAPSLSSVGLAVLAGSVLSFVGAVGVQRHLLPWICPKWGTWDLHVFKEMVFTGGWMTVNMMGSVLFLNIDLIVINRLLGPEEAGLYAPVLQITAGLRTVGAMLSGLFAPTLMLQFGKKDFEGMMKYSRRAVRFVGLLVALPVGSVCAFAPEILTVWLGPAFRERWPYVLLLVGSLAINLPAQPLFQIQFAANRVILPALVTLCSGLANLVLAFLLCRNLGSIGVALSGVVLLSLKNLIFTPLYNAAILGVPRRIAFAGLYASLITVSLVGGLGFVFRQCLPLEGNALLLAGVPLTLLIAGPLIYFCIVEAAEREEMWHRLGRCKSDSLQSKP